MSQALRVQDVSHAIGGRSVLSDVSLTVPAGSFTVLLGPNGAGKTTLVSLITGLFHAQSGSIAVFGHPVATDGARARAALGVVFQMPTLDLDLTVVENLRYQAALHGMDRREATLRIAERLGQLGLAERSRERVRALSGGLRRRAEIARALLQGPRLLLCDEASVGLDPQTRTAILGLLRGLSRDEGLSVLWATHLLDEVEPADPTVVLHHGRVRWTGPAGDLARSDGAAGLAAGFLALTDAA